MSTRRLPETPSNQYESITTTTAGQSHVNVRIVRAMENALLMWECGDNATRPASQKSPCNSEDGATRSGNGSDAQITERDRVYMLAFPTERRMHIMVDVMSRPNTSELNLIGDGCYAHAISEMRAQKLDLIDLQPMETAFLAVWHSDGVIESSTPQREVVAQMLWEQDGDEERVTLKLWKL